ncbi:MAG: hypothetical protein H8E26_01685 [FCB group bacterium]|nr:hypothetical protein [FCB group bacterium]MBL7029413.1 hypothetical protein [Candidatus Neomarinimicrobiota bacterium]MBL7123196.1 hypothetical protein [Candidatus Neomarinimicrobiota bacterium]
MKLKIVLMLFISTSILAWDGERKGFVLGLGFGPGYDVYSGIQWDAIGADEGSNSSWGFAASPKIGYALNNNTALFYTRYPLSYNVKSSKGSDVGIISCTEALQLVHFLEDQAPSMFFGLGTGIGYFFDQEVKAEPSMNYSPNSLKGLGLLASVGFEPFKHITTELAIHYRAPQKDASVFAFTLLVSAMGF